MILLQGVFSSQTPAAEPEHRWVLAPCCLYMQRKEKLTYVQWVYLTSRCRYFTLLLLRPGRSFLPRLRPLPVLLVTGGGYLGYNHYRSSGSQEDGAPPHLATPTEVGAHPCSVVCLLEVAWGLSVELDEQVWRIPLAGCLMLCHKCKALSAWLWLSDLLCRYFEGGWALVPPSEWQSHSCECWIKLILSLIFL